VLILGQSLMSRAHANWAAVSYVAGAILVPAWLLTRARGIAWLRECGVQVVDLDSAECRDLLAAFIARHPEVWNEDIGD
jgi:hypothetical protein